MKLSALICLLPACAFAYKLGFSSQEQVFRTTIPGGSPVDTCQSPAPEDDLIEITHLELFPNPPEKGQNLTITASGIVKEDIEQGAYAMIRVKYGLITLIRTTLDLCEQTDKIDLSCPIKAGEVTLKRDVELPAVIPPGRYQAQADVYTEDGRPVTCLVANVKYDDLKDWLTLDSIETIQLIVRHAAYVIVLVTGFIIAQSSISYLSLLFVLAD